MLITPNMTIEDRVKAFREWLINKKQSFADVGNFNSANIMKDIINMYDTIFDDCEIEKEEIVTMKKLRKIVRTCTIDSYLDFLNTKQGTDKEKGSKLLYNFFEYINKALTVETKEND